MPDLWLLIKSNSILTISSSHHGPRQKNTCPQLHLSPTSFLSWVLHGFVWSFWGQKTTPHFQPHAHVLSRENQRLRVQKTRQMETPVPDQRFAREGELLFDPGAKWKTPAHPDTYPTHQFCRGIDWKGRSETFSRCAIIYSKMGHFHTIQRSKADMGTERTDVKLCKLKLGCFFSCEHESTWGHRVAFQT